MLSQQELEEAANCRQQKTVLLSGSLSQLDKTDLSLFVDVYSIKCSLVFSNPYPGISGTCENGLEDIVGLTERYCTPLLLNSCRVN